MPSANPPAGFVLAFSDEFETPGSLDPAKWGYEIGYIRNDEKQFYTSRSENVRAEGGNLVIEARKEAHQGYGYTSASVNTLGRFEFLYGRVEVRAKLPTGNGSWPAIWTLGTNLRQVDWPACGEIDIMENVGHEPGIAHGTLHGPGYSGAEGIGAAFTLPAGRRFADDFHVFAVEWEPNVLRFFVDGQLYQTQTPATLPSGSRWVFDHPFFLILNVAVGGNWPGPPDETTVFPQRMLVDYVRVYRRRQLVGETVEFACHFWAAQVRSIFGRPPAPSDLRRAVINPLRVG
jgi:beta-glucanase (GH16 family)